MSAGGLPFAIGYNTNGFLSHRLEDALEVLAALGYGAVAITLDVHHLDPFRATAADLRALRARLEGLRLRPAIETGARYILDPRRRHHPTLLSGAGAERRADYLARAIRVAESLGAEVVSIWSGVPEGEEGEGFRRLEAGLRPLLAEARRAGVLLALEPEPGHLVATLEGYRRFKAASGLADLRLTLDTGHLRCSEPLPPARTIRAGADDLVNVHLDDNDGSEHKHLAPGEGDLDWAEVLGALRDAGFRGVASLELTRHVHAAPETAERAIAFLRGVLARRRA